MTLVPGARIGAYEIVGKVGAGGMGAVYRARDRHLGRDVALKLLPDDVAGDESRRGRLHREARALAALSDPRIAGIYGWEESGGRAVLVMEFVDGRPLSEIIGRGGVPLGRAVRYAVQIVAGLAAAHRAGIVHRDLKPSNIMVTAAGDIKLVDFGLARSAAEQALPEGEATRSYGGHTSAGLIVGTAAYMSPEQAQGLPVDHRSDIFSFGAVLYEMCTGRPPFRGDNPATTLAAILKDEPEPPSRARGEALPADLERLILKCLRKDRDRRVQTAADLRVSLEDLGEDLSSGAIAVSPVQRREARAYTRPLVVATGVMAIAAAGWAIWSRSSAPRPTVPLRQLTFEAGVALTPALSPDGRLLAYASDRAGDGVLDVWVKQVAGGDPVRVTSGIGGVSHPQFSPDGTKVYVLGYQNDIFEVSTFGGAPQMVIEAAGPFSIASSGEIAFARVGTGGTASTIQIVSTPGGTAVPWRPECQSITAPAWSPDGRRLAFVGKCHDAAGLFLAPRDGGSATRVPIREPSGLPEPTPLETLLSPSRLRGFIGWSSLGWFRADDGREGVIATWREGDTININRLYFDGTREPLTLGTGWETGPGVAANGAVAFMRAEMTPTVWSVPLEQPAGSRAAPRREVAPANLFAVSKDGRMMTFGRVLGPDRGELRARRIDGGDETVLASHPVANWGVGSFWGTISQDGRRVFYRVNRTTRNVFYVVPTTGGTARELSIFDGFNLGSDWDQGDSRVLGECQPTTKGVCAVDPVSGRVTTIVTDPQGAELLYPSMSWDGRWMTFMRRLSGATAVYVAPEGADGIPRRFGEWVPISPRGLTGARPRFAPDGNSLFYLLTDRGTVSLVRQPLDSATKHPIGEPTRITAVQVFPTTLSYSFGASASIIEVTRDRVYFNTIDLRSNAWLTGVR